MSSKLIYDPIHGYMELDSRCISIIDTPEFKRLKKIKQLGTCYEVFPGASHNRFEHSLGVGYLAGELIDKLLINQPHLNIGGNTKSLIQIAGLCHDLGHGPFSHVFDNEILSVLNPNSAYRHHEARSCMVLEHLVTNNNINLTRSEIDYIKGLIIPDVNNSDYLHNIVCNVNSGVDVDKFDYLKRDTYNIGLEYSYNYSRLLKQARVIDNQICFPEKIAPNIYNIFSTRYRLHKDIYNHPVVKSIEYMIADALIAADDVIGLSKSIDNQAFSGITDEILYSIKTGVNPELQQSRNILNNIDKRNIYTYIGCISLPTDLIISRDLVYETLFTDSIIEKQDIIVQNMSIGYTNNNTNPVDFVKFYNSINKDASFNISKQQVSMLLPDIFQEKSIRLFSRTNDADKINKMREILNSC